MNLAIPLALMLASAVPSAALPGDTAQPVPDAPAWRSVAMATSLALVTAGVVLLVAEPSCDYRVSQAPTGQIELISCANWPGVGAGGDVVDDSFHNWQDGVQRRHSLAQALMLAGFATAAANSILARGGAPFSFELGVGTFAYAPSARRWDLAALPFTVAAGIHLGEWATVSGLLRYAWPGTFAGGLRVGTRFDAWYVDASLLAGKIGCHGDSEFSTCPDAYGPLVEVSAGYRWRLELGRFSLGAGFEAFDAKYVSGAFPTSTGLQLGVLGPRFAWEW